MGILNEMFGDGENLPEKKEGELLADGDYVSDKSEMLLGYGVFRKKYVLKSLMLKLVIVAAALASSVFMIVSTPPGGGRDMPVFCLILCGFIGGWFIAQFISNKKKYSAGIDGLAGIPYHAEIYTDKIIISDTSPVKQSEEKTVSEDISDEVSENPTTVIHLDSPIVDILDTESSFIIVVKKAYVFIIPKSAFNDEEIIKIREKFSAIMGIRYRVLK